MSDELNMSFRRSELIMTTYELQQRMVKIQDANTHPEVGSSMVNGTHIKETTTIHNISKTCENIESTEQTHTSRTSANTATCSGKEKGSGSDLRPTGDVTTGEGLLNAAKARLIFLPTAPPALQHHLPSQRGYRVTPTAGSAVDRLKGVEAVVRSPRPDLRSLTRHTVKGIPRVISLIKIVLLTLNEGMSVTRRNVSDEKTKLINKC